VRRSAGGKSGSDETTGPAASGRPGGAGISLSALVNLVGDELAGLDRELEEIGLLAGQAASETERHRARREKGEERVKVLEKDPRPNADEVREARTQLIALTRREMLFDAQKEVLEGKQKTLLRYREGLSRIHEQLSRLDPDSTRPVPAAVANERRPADSAAVLRAQEDLRRDIARQMHDGPAQSLANIALQSEIVERLVARGDQRATLELGSLRRMVQNTLTATKEFIFDVRPMVLDDLGLVPTLRRTAIDRGHRAGLEVDFDSSGADRRLSPDLESGLFRLIDDLIAGYLALRPARITVRLDWSERDLSAVVRGHWQADGGDAPRSAPAGRGGSQDLPPALRQMIEDTDSEEREARVVSRSLPAARLQDLRDRATTLGVSLTVREDGQATEIVVPTV
jgi:two-component system sensor histidine kinase DegS